MAKGNTSSIAAARPEIWGKELMADVIDGLYFMENGLMGEDENNIIQIKTDLKGKRGDTVDFQIVRKLSRVSGVTGDSELEGNEQQLSTVNEQVAIDQWRDGVRLVGRLDEQMNAFNLRTEAKAKLKILGQEFLEQQFFLKLGAVCNTSLTDINGTVVGTYCAWSNTPDYIPDADETNGTGDRYLCADASGTTSIAATDVLTPALIDAVVLKAKTCAPKIVPLRINGKNYYVLFVHPRQAYDLKQNAVFNQARREAEVRGKENPIFTGALGIWNGVIIHEHEYVPFLDASVAGNSFRAAASGTDAAYDLYRALLCGRQAGLYAQCDNPNAWAEESFDYGNKHGFSISIMGGVQKTMFTDEYGVIALDTATSFSAAG